MWALFFLLTAMADDCDQTLNAVDFPYINPDCNFKGACDRGSCLCCDYVDPNNFCNKQISGKWSGTQCQNPTAYTAATFGILLHDGVVSCGADGQVTPSFLGEVTDSLGSNNYSGEVIENGCGICTSESPCPEISAYGTLIKFATDFNTYYDKDCGEGNIPVDIRPCPANKDFGGYAFVAFDGAYVTGDHEAFLSALYGSSLSEVDVVGLYEDYQTVQATNVWNTRAPTRPPTKGPTPIPTPMPTEFKIQFPRCEAYSNDIDDIVYGGRGSSCRANIDESWPGARTCESPYIICLPEENTPALDGFGNRYYLNDTHRYTVDECKLECALDQRCLGIEFVADSNSLVGDCNLIDDIPIGIENEVVSPVWEYTDDHEHDSLDSSTTSANALCFEKANDYCIKYYEGEDLNAEMLDCYCPNNRKGSYTKKVKRTTNNTRFCDNDASVDERIREAQANRMFHLCENWCLFQTLNPEEENWYWDPWKQCWRETYSGVGGHRAYCDRVIRNPDSIELRYINNRREHFCFNDTQIPTSSPVADINTAWYLAERLESCDEACDRNGKNCAPEQTATRFLTESDLIAAFSEAGVDCTSNIIMNSTSYEGWALPGVMNSRVCVNRQPPISHLSDVDSDCSRKIGSSWQRLCACF